MSRKAKLFNRKASSPKSKANEILEGLNLGEGYNIADIGAGGGYFTLKFAERVGSKGHVFAVDTDSELSNFVRESARENGLPNIETIISDGNELELPEGELDLIFMRNVTHHIDNRVQYFKNLLQFLNPTGRVVIIEYRDPSRFSFRGIFGHYVPKDVLIKEMKQAGYVLKEDLELLPEQSFTIYGPSKT